MRDVFTDNRPCHSHLLPSLQPERSEHQTIRAVRGCKARDLASLILHHAAPTASVWASPLAPRVRTARRAAVDGRRGPAHGPFDSFGWPGLAVSPLSRLGRKGLPGSRFIVVEPAEMEGPGEGVFGVPVYWPSEAFAPLSWGLLVAAGSLERWLAAPGGRAGGLRSRGLRVLLPGQSVELR
jgi:hypothetical protein